MLRAAQTKWIGRFMAKSSIQDALLQYEQQLRDAAMSFQVRGPFLLPAQLEIRTKTRNQFSSLIEIHYAIGSTKGDSNKPLRVTSEDTVTSPIEFPEPLLPQSSSAGTLSESTISTFEFENTRSSSGSTDSFTLVEADPEALVTESEPQTPAIPEPTEEELFLADLSGETDEFGVRD